MPGGNPNLPGRPNSRGTVSSRDRRWRGSSQNDGAAVSPPIVVTLGLGVVSDTTANVVGSVNPNGSDTSWWITYGTSLPLPGDFSTTPIDVGSGTGPVTTTGQIVSLSPGVTYYVTVAAANAGGVTYGQPVSFVAAVPVASTTPFAGTVNPYGQPSVTIPHFSQPFTLALSGVAVVEQDTLEEVRSNVITICDCVVGQCSLLPNFGRPDLTFALEPVDTFELVNAINQLEPRANEDALSSLSIDGQSWNIALMTSTTAGETI